VVKHADADGGVELAVGEGECGRISQQDPVSRVAAQRVESGGDVDRRRVQQDDLVVVGVLAGEPAENPPDLDQPFRPTVAAGPNGR